MLWVRDAPPAPAWVPLWVVGPLAPGLAGQEAPASLRPNDRPAALPACRDGRRGSIRYTEVPLECMGRWEGGPPE